MLYHSRAVLFQYQEEQGVHLQKRFLLSGTQNMSEKLEEYSKMMLHYNEFMNLTAITEPEEIKEKGLVRMPELQNTQPHTHSHLMPNFKSKCVCMLLISVNQKNIYLYTHKRFNVYKT